VLAQTGKVTKFPVVLVGCDYWAGLLAWLRDQVLARGYISAIDIDAIPVTDDVEDVIRFVTTPVATRRPGQRVADPSTAAERSDGSSRLFTGNKGD